MISSGNLDQLSMQQLRSVSKYYNLPPIFGETKAHLIERLLDVLNQPPEPEGEMSVRVRRIRKSSP